MNSELAALPMYPYAGLRAAWDELYVRVATQVAQQFPQTPRELDWNVGAHESWVHPHLALSQSCGWPLVTQLRDRVRVIGTFAHVIDGVSSHLYRSVIVARRDLPLSALSHARAAINSADSLSGCISLLSACGVTSGQWPGEVTLTGSHLASIGELQHDRADVASIDALSWAYLQRLDPLGLHGLFQVGRGPQVPCLPLIIGGLGVTGDADVDAHARVAAWRSAFALAMLDPQLASVRDTLLIDGFVPLDHTDYEATLAAYTRSS